MGPKRLRFGPIRPMTTKRNQTMFFACRLKRLTEILEETVAINMQWVNMFKVP